MSESVKQSLSALMDDEADRFECRRVLGQLDDESAAAWQRYHAVRAVLQGVRVSPDVDISGAVAEAVAAEEGQDAVDGSVTARGWIRSLTSVAVAASVTAAVIFGFQQQESAVQVAERGAVTLPAPQPARSGVLEAGYGIDRMAVNASAPQAEIIRASSSLSAYIDQHQALIRQPAQQWQAGWMPQGYREVRHSSLPQGEVMLFSDGRNAITVSVEPLGARKAEPGVAQSGDTLAFGKPVGDHFVTVVGDLPLMMADRIASSVTLSE